MSLFYNFTSGVISDANSRSCGRRNLLHLQSESSLVTRETELISNTLDENEMRIQDMSIGLEV